MVLLIISFLLLIFLLFLFIPFNVVCKFYVDAFKKFGAYSIKIALINILCGKFEIKQDKLHILNLTNKMPKSSKFGDLFGRKIAEQVQDISCELFFAFGKKNDAFWAAMMCATTNCAVNAIFSVLSAKKEQFNGVVLTIPSTNLDQLSLTAQVVIKMSLIDVVIAFVLAVFRRDYGKQSNW